MGQLLDIKKGAVGEVTAHKRHAQAAVDSWGINLSNARTSFPTCLQG
jgi:hypothetical protein